MTYVPAYPKPRRLKDRGYLDGAIICKALLEQLPDAKERRIHSLLQAAATIYAGSYVDLGAGTAEAFTGFNVTFKRAVADAETLLAEIERREAAEAKR